MLTLIVAYSFGQAISIDPCGDSAGIYQEMREWLGYGSSDLAVLMLVNYALLSSIFLSL